MSIKRKWLVVISVMALLLVGVSAVGAQNGPGGPGGNGPGGQGGMGGRQGRPDGFQNGPFRQIADIVADATGLDPADIAQQVRDGATLADIITANGGDVDEVIDQVMTALTDEINQAVADGRITQERADTLLTSLEDTVTSATNGELFPNCLDGGLIGRVYEGGVLMQAVASATGLEVTEIRQQVRDGATLADIITANGGDVDAVVTAAVAAATEQINTAVADGRLSQEQADQLLANLSDHLTAAVNGELPLNGPVQMRIEREVLQLAAEQTGLEPQVIIEQIQSGKSLADVLTENNVDVNAFIDSAVDQAVEHLNRAVDNGRINQERADEMTQDFRDRLTERINQTGTAEELPAV